MLVAMVIAPVARLGHDVRLALMLFAFNTSCGIFGAREQFRQPLRRSMEVVPTNTG